MSHTPIDDFGKLLFDDWTVEEWLAFDNYMINNLQMFLMQDFAQPEFKNLEIRKFINATSFEFFEWADDPENSTIRKPRVSKSELFEDFINEYTDYKKWLRKKTFQNWLKEFSKFKGIDYTEGNSNGVRWCNLAFKMEEPELDEIVF